MLEPVNRNEHSVGLSSHPHSRDPLWLPSTYKLLLAAFFTLTTAGTLQRQGSPLPPKAGASSPPPAAPRPFARQECSAPAQPQPSCQSSGRAEAALLWNSRNAQTPCQLAPGMTPPCPGPGWITGNTKTTMRSRSPNKELEPDIAAWSRVLKGDSLQGLGALADRHHGHLSRLKTAWGCQETFFLLCREQGIGFKALSFPLKEAQTFKCLWVQGTRQK